LRNFVLAALWLLFCATGQAAERIVIGAEDAWYPYTGNMNGELRGMTVDIVREAFALQGVDVTFEMVPYTRCLNLTRRGQYVACFNVARSSQTELDFLWPDKPILRPKINIYARKGSGLKHLGVNDLKGRKVAVTRSYEYGSEFDSDRQIQRVVVDDDTKCFRMVAAQRAEFTVAYDRVGSFVIKQLQPQLGDAFEIVGDVAQVDIHLAFSRKNPDAQRHLATFNKGLAALFKSHKYQEIERAWQ
jgi:polar amino acid transport system substrate-binding protein